MHLPCPLRRLHLLPVGLCLGIALGHQPLRAAPLLADSPGAADFVLAQDGRAAGIWLEPKVDKSVRRAAEDLAADIERVTGIKPPLSQAAAGPRDTLVLVGVLGQSKLIDSLAASGKLDVSGVRGEWESCVVQVVVDPMPEVSRALVIAGSDRRGAIYGIYEVSESIGVSPWHWWADVPVKKRAALAIRAGAHKLGPPSVKYRGIFLNDEDWGLQPWAAKTFDPESGGIGPKTYARIFELLLRLKANTLWPAMHACTRAFNLDPQNRLLADDFGVVMGSSHAEPMLRNNVTEWTASPESYNYLTNPTGVRKYWDTRVRENGRFENIYTLGMRGIHDSAMVGPNTDPERIATLERIFADQRKLLAKRVNPDATRVPQAFTPYKEVLGICNAGLRVPADVTLVWPDDNFGYIRHFPTVEEQKRPGGSGVYYHLSYLGHPLSYLWLCTTPPALVWEEMSKAYDHGARTIWIANVGDLKPAEIGTEFFLQMAWDINRWRRENLPEFLVEWAAREFGSDHAREIATIMDQYYRLNFQRKPEHLQWWLPGEAPRPSPLNLEEARERLEAFAQLRARVDRLGPALPETSQDAFFELVTYPVRGSALANERIFYGELSARGTAPGQTNAADLARTAQAADTRLREETRVFNEKIAGGKWRHFIALEPADNQWSGMRIAPWTLPPPSVGLTVADNPANVPGVTAAGASGFVESGGVVSIKAEHFTGRVDRGDVGWRVLPGLGRAGDSVAVFPTTAESIDPGKLGSDAPRLDYQVNFSTTGDLAARFDFLPTQPIRPGAGLRLAVALDDQAPQVLTAGTEVGSAAWAQSVLNEVVSSSARLRVPTAGAHVLRVFMVDAGVLLDKIVIDCGGLKPSYLGPPETLAAK